MTNHKQTEPNTTHPVITQEALAQLGDGRLAYVKTIRSEEVANLFPQAPKIEPGDQAASPPLQLTARQSIAHR